MAGKKSKAAAERESRASRLTRAKFMTFIRAVGTLRGELDDASMAHAAEFKKADSLGIHKPAVTLVMKLDKMESAKRADFLRSFDKYRDEYMTHWDAQADLLEEVGEEDASEDGEGQGDGEGDPTVGDPTVDQPATVEAAAPEPEAVDGVEADHGEELPLVATSDLEEAGFTFASGKAAGLSGEPVVNPHPEGMPAYDTWARGHALGTKLLAEPPEAEVEEAPRKGRRRPKDDEAGENVTRLH